MPIAHAGVRRNVALPRKKSTVRPPPYLALTRSVNASLAARPGSRTAVPSRITGSLGSLVVTVARGSRSRLRALRERGPQLNHTASPSHTPHTGVTCGRPSGWMVATQ
jgi:hypothetical protein